MPPFLRNPWAPGARLAPLSGTTRPRCVPDQLWLADQEAGKNPPFDMKLEAMIPVIKGEMPLKAHAHRADDILTSIRFAKEFGVKLTLDHCTDGSLIAIELAE